MRHVKGSCCTTIKSIGVSSGKTQILHDVSFHLHCGELTVIIGPNGAGKTTLLKALLGELRHTGSIQFHDPSGEERRIRIGYVPQKLDLDPNSPVSVYDFFAAMISRRPVFLSKGRFLHKKIGEYLAEFEMDDKLDRRLCDLSGGELQRVLLAVATHPAPELLILDEPVSGIDSNGMSVFYEKLGALKRERDMAILMVSHDLHYVAQYADKMLLLDQTVLSMGTPKEGMASDAFKREFNVFVEAEDR